MGIKHSIIGALVATCNAEEVDFSSDFIRKVTAPEEGEEIYMYIVAVIIGTLIYFIYEKYEEMRQPPQLEQFTLGDAVEIQQQQENKAKKDQEKI